MNTLRLVLATAVLALCIAFGLLFARRREPAQAAATAEPARAAAPQAGAPAPAGALHGGESEEGSFQEALDAALRAAQGSMAGADGRFEWELVSVRGVRGGIRGERALRVEIRVR